VQSGRLIVKVSAVMSTINCQIWGDTMQNAKPKSGMPALKENAAKDKDKQARQKSTDKERVAKTRGDPKRKKQLQ
jgi:hypothetical protein